jgi:parvulin-like peptidyl-prolyl isomerase
MGIYFKVSLAILLLVIMVGCAGSKKTITPDESMFDSTRIFIFAETEVLDIDSDLMADKFGAKQRTGKAVSIDSASAHEAVYDILVDSILGLDAAHFDLSVEQPALHRQYLRLRYDKVMRAMYQSLIVDSVSVDTPAVKALYEERLETLMIPDKYRARHIVVAGEGLKFSDDSAQYTGMSDEQLDSIAHALVVGYRQRILEGAAFDTLAMLYSQDVNSAGYGGDLGLFELSQMVHPFDSTIENTPVGDVSGVIKTDYGWHVVKVEEFAPAHHAPLDSVYMPLWQELMEKQIAVRGTQFVDSLAESATLAFDTAAMEMADSLHNDDDLMMIVNPLDTEFGNDSVLFRDYNQHVYSYKSFKKLEGELTFADKEEILKGTAIQKLLMQTARKQGYYNLPEIEEWVEQTIKKYSVSVLRKRLVDVDYIPSEEEIRAYYDSHIDEYKVERPYKVQHIVFEDSSLAEHVRDLLMSGADFMEMVDLYYPGDPEIKRAAADLGEIGPNDMPSTFYAAAKRTAAGDISRPTKTQYGYHLIKVLEKTPSIEYDRAKTKIITILGGLYLKNTLEEFVDTRLEQPPVIHWDKVDKLYFESSVVVEFPEPPRRP